MSIKTRKRIWSSALVMSIAMVGVLAAFLVLAGGSGITEAHEPPAGQTHAQVCADMVPAVQGLHDAFTAADAAKCAAEMDSGNGNGNGMDDEFMHATMPMDFWLEALDNGARLSWEMPNTVAPNASIVRYQIHRDAWHSMPSHPINSYGDATIDVDVYMTDHRDLGLAYETAYTYRTRAVVEYNVEGWWNMLNCVQMNDAVSPTGDEPAVGADTDGTTYCKMYDDLSAEAMVVVQRAYAALDPMAYTYYGEWSMKRTTETADSGGRLAALLDPPTMVQDIDAIAACANMVTVSWQAPSYLGTVPAMNQRGVYVGPDYIGADDAGREEVGTDATSVTYQVQRMVNNGPWATVAHTDMMYTDRDVGYAEEGMPPNVYKYRVRAMNGMRGAGLNGPWTMVTETLTEPARPLRPGSPVAKHETDASGNSIIALNWDAPDDTGTNLWRSLADIGGMNKSKSLSYRVERRIGDGAWVILAREQAHQYIPGETPAEAINHFHKQKFVDSDTNAIRAANVAYRVAARVYACNQSEWISVDEVEGTAQLTLGTPASVTATSRAAGAITVSYIAGVNATGHLIILAQGSTLVDFDVSIDGSDASFSNVAAGNYTAIVVSFRRMGGTLEFEHSRSTVTVN
jgi:hypothetical protein